LPPVCAASLPPLISAPRRPWSAAILGKFWSGRIFD
jgi:hypothetical protein